MPQKPGGWKIKKGFFCFGEGSGDKILGLNDPLNRDAI
jgi:hypothetical protein